MTDGSSVPAEVFSHYRELLRAEPWLETAACWTVVVPHDRRPFSVADIGSRVSGGRPHDVHEAAPLDALPYYDGVHPMSAAPAGSAVLLFENNGFLGSLPEVLRRLSRDGRACGVYWNVEGNNRLSYAADGRVLVSLDAMFSEEWDDDDFAVLEPELRVMTELVAENEDDWQAAAMTVVELVTGVRLTTEWLSGEHPYLTFQWPVATEPPSPEELAAHRDDPETKLRAAVRAAPQARQFAALAHLAEVLAARFRLGEFPVVRHVLTDLASGRRGGEHRAGELRERLVAPLAQEFHDCDDDSEDDMAFEQDPAWQRMQAGVALEIAARGPVDPALEFEIPHVFDAYHHAGLALGCDWPSVRKTVREILTSTDD
ncbi:DUF6461 domain-containing protein [Microbispora sp. H11081]|uniref:DUF6461 domain-containing protein n=1 Tax=Microbispora sp. H11081 TaxID=2729107 RepID=UPI0014738697|nr:DUF6461 domain-containing protein [Microbispora sp. H11081]